MLREPNLKIITLSEKGKSLMSQFLSKLDKVIKPIKQKIHTFLHNLKNEEKQSNVEANMFEITGTIKVWLWIHDEWIQYKNMFTSTEQRNTGLLCMFLSCHVRVSE